MVEKFLMVLVSMGLEGIYPFSLLSFGFFWFACFVLGNTADSCNLAEKKGEIHPDPVFTEPV